MRSRLVLSLALAAVSVAACNVPESSFGPDFCLPLDGPCPTNYGGGVQSTTVSWIAGLPFERVNTTAGWVDLIPGDSVTLHLLTGPSAPQRSGDTVRVVTWAVANAAAARITPGQGGDAALVAIAPGTVTITANGGSRQMFACGPNDCWLVWNVRVVAPPTPSTR
jgi:hypothetical protein